MLRSVYDWSEVEGQSGGDYENLRLYAAFQPEYNSPATEPDWGPMSVSYWRLTPDQAKSLNAGKYINNSSWVVVAEIADFKIVFPGDIEKDGWLALLRQADFQHALQEPSVFVASHHGHSSGYVPEIYRALGRPWFNLVSCHRKDENVDSSYARSQSANGVTYNGVTRYSFTTRLDGSCRIRIGEDGNWNFHFYALPENLD